jgi:hypothetical protein
LWETLDQSCYMDAAVSYSFTTPTATLKNLGHLEGKAVVALADGAVVKGLTVTSGAVTLPDPALKVTVGLPFTSTIETLPLAIQTPQGGWTLAKPQQASKVVLRVNNSRGFLVGPTVDLLDEPRARTTEPYGSPPALITGLVEATLRPYARTTASIVIQSADPLPLEVTQVLIDPSVA